MTILREDDSVLLVDVCSVEESEALLHQVQAGATRIDWSGCVHLHAACLQVVLVSGLPIHGTPANPALARWVAPLCSGAATLADPASAVITQEEV